MTDASSSLVTKVDQLDTDTNAFLREVGANTAGIDKALKDNESSLKAIDTSYTSIFGHTIQAKLAAERTEAFSEAKSLRQAMHLAVAPRPDLWLPLVSNLKLREGFGDVSFSRSTTATYINKSGQLVTAQANEPRFEREGLLVEGGSTNLVPYSDSAERITGTLTKTTVANFPNIDGSSKSNRVELLETGKLNYTATYSQSNIKEKTVYTASVWVCEKTLKFERFILYDNNNSFTIKASTEPSQICGEWKKYIVTGSTNTNLSTLRAIVYFKTNCPVGSYSYVGKFQIEQLPFATSYIPTNGQPVTRDRETVYTNFRQITGDFTLAGELHCLGYASNYSRIIADYVNNGRIEYGNIDNKGLYINTYRYNRTSSNPAGWQQIKSTINPDYTQKPAFKFVVHNSGTKLSGFMDGVKTQESTGNICPG